MDGLFKRETLLTGGTYRAEPWSYFNEDGSISLGDDVNVAAHAQPRGQNSSIWNPLRQRNWPGRVEWVEASNPAQFFTQRIRRPAGKSKRQIGETGKPYGWW